MWPSREKKKGNPIKAFLSCTLIILALKLLTQNSVMEKQSTQFRGATNLLLCTFFPSLRQVCWYKEIYWADTVLRPWPCFVYTCSWFLTQHDRHPARKLAKDKHLSKQVSHFSPDCLINEARAEMEHKTNSSEKIKNT